MKTVLITGASRGIGRATAEKFLAESWFVIGTSTSGKVDIDSSNLISVKLDLSSSQSISEAVLKINELGKEIDVLVNNAGIVVDEEEGENRINIEYLRKTLEVNLIGTIDFAEGVIPLIKEGGKIFNISSKAGALGFEEYKSNYPAYRISKAGLNMFTRVLEVRFEGKIKVYSVNPGSVKTDMNGPDGEREPSEVADDIYKLVLSDVESGQFWYKGENFPW